MATLANANLPSDDEEDLDFVPDEVDSEDEALKRKQQKKPAKKKRGRVRGAAAAGADTDDDDGDEPTEAPPPEEPEHVRAEKKAKMDEMCSKLNAGGGSAAPKPKPAVNLAALCKPVSAKGKGKKDADASWMRQLGIKSGSGSGDKKEEEKKEMDTKAVAAAALAAAKTAASATAAQQIGMVTVTETRRFAGKTVTLQREVDAKSKEAAKAGEAAAAAAKKKAGLDAVLESLAQAKKVTVLDKSRLDWKDYKKTDETVEEELETHKRSGGTYLEKQAFLKGAELAEYERERDARLAADVRNRGRL